MKNQIFKKSLSFCVAVLMTAVTFFAVTPITASAYSGYEFVEASGIVQQYRTDYNSAWYELNPSVLVENMNGVKLRTDGKPYFFKYRTINRGQSGNNWLEYVYSNSANANDFAGWKGFPVTNLAIEVYDNSNNFLHGDCDYVVMYRSKTAGEWLSWVSNGNLEIMQSIQSKFNLGGSLDAKATDAGYFSKGNIEALEIRVYEKISTVPEPEITPSDNAKIIDAPYINQIGVCQNGCESVSTVMALKYLGVDISVDSFVDNYLDKGAGPNIKEGTGGDPSLCYPGNPKDTTGYGCYSPVI
ncbi:MAG: C39 family peptidase, partial [Oscillospiraceae bacterium]